MLNYEDQYIANLRSILYSGKCEINERTGIKTVRVPATTIVIDLQKEFPILLSKKIFWKTALKEILWIMQSQSNKISDLKSNIWNAWADEEGTIGKAYGYQIGKPFEYRGEIYKNQVDYVLRTLQRDPSNRQCVINMWNVAELDEMMLVPCVYSSVWNIIDNKLNCMLIQRSADYPIGVPFDTTQYAILLHLFARHLNVEPGILTHNMADSHIYENQIEGTIEQLRRYDSDEIVEGTPFIAFDSKMSTNFWEANIDQIDIKDYNPLDAIIFQVAK